MEPIIIKSDNVTKAIIDEIRTSPDDQFNLIRLREKVSETEKISKSTFHRVIIELTKKGLIKRTNQKVNRRPVFNRNSVAIGSLVFQHSIRDLLVRTIQTFHSTPGERFTWHQIHQELHKQDPNINASTIRNYFCHLKTGGMIKEVGKLAGSSKIKLYKLVEPIEKKEPEKARQTITRDEVFDIMIERLNELKKLKQEYNKAIIVINNLRKTLKYINEQSIDEIKATNSWKQCVEELEKEVAELMKIKERNENIGKLTKEKSEADEQIRSITNENYKLKRQISNPNAQIDAIKTAHKEETEKLNETITTLRKLYSEKEKELTQSKVAFKELQKEKTIQL